MFLLTQRLMWFVFFIVSNELAAGKTLPENIPTRIFVEQGNIYYILGDNKKNQVTNIGKDHSPRLSPDKKIIAFIRTTNISIPKTCAYFVDTGSDYTKQIWTYDIATKKERLLVKNNFLCDEPKKMIVDPNDLQFSPDGKTLYFFTSAWTTSGALHAINIDGAKLRYVTPALSYEVIHGYQRQE